MGEEIGVDEVVGRWQLDRGRALDRNSTLHQAQLIGGSGDADRLVEVHRLSDGFDASEAVANLRQASRISDPGLVTIVDVGAATLADQPVVYVVTARWQEALGPGPRAEDELLAMAGSLAGGLSTLHRSNLIHGAIHRGGVRLGAASWQLGPAGLASFLETEIAPYRPPGLHVVEPAAPPADLWSLGVVLHEQATGRLIRPGEEPRLPAMPRLEALVADLLRLNPDERPTADEVVERLSRVAEPSPPPGGAASAPASASASTSTATSTPTSTAWGPPTAPPGTQGSGQASGTGSGGRPGRPVVLYGAALAVAVLAGVVAAISLLGGDDGGEVGATETTAGEATTDDTPAGADGEDGDDDGAEADGGAIELEEPDEQAPTDVDEPTVPTGPVGLDQLVTGECIDVDLTLGDPTSAVLVPCSESYVAEVIGLVPPPANDGAYPGRAALLEQGQSACEAEFETYVGGPSLLTSLFVLTTVPTFGEWDRDERRDTLCLAHNFDNAALSGGLAGRFGGYQLVEGSEAPIAKFFGARCFEIDGEIDTIGRRQVVSLIGCENLHKHEVLNVEAVPLNEEELASEVLTPAITTKLANEGPAVCQELWDGFSMPDGTAEPTINAIMPNVLDWQLGDRLMTCTASWDEPILGSVVLLNLPPPGTGDDDG